MTQTFKLLILNARCNCRRNKVINYFSLMFRKRLRGDDAADDENDPEEKKAKGKAKKGILSNHLFMPHKQHKVNQT